MINHKSFQLLGHLGEKINIKKVNDKNMYVLNLAVNEFINKEQKTSWFSIIGFSNNAKYLDFLQTIEKGTNLLVQGSLSIKEGNKESNTFNSITLIVEELEILSAKKSLD